LEFVEKFTHQVGGEVENKTGRIDDT